MRLPLNYLSLPIAVGILVTCGACGTTKSRHRDAPERKAIQVSRHISVELDNATADRILADMGEVARTKDSPDDVPSNVEFVRSGDVSVFTEGNGIVNSREDFKRLGRLGPRVKVVHQINWCGSLIPNVLGCAELSGDSMVVVRSAPWLEGILWLHEYGHNMGLRHRDDSRAVMNSVIDAFHRELDAVESGEIQR